MNDIEKILFDTTTKIFKDLCTKELVIEAEQGQFPNKLWNELDEMGVTKVAIPEEKGGSGFGYSEGLTILKTSGAYAAPIPLAETYIGNWFLNEMDVDIAEGLVTVVPPKNMEQIVLEKADENWVINGVANFVPFARYVDQIVTVGKTSDGNYVLAVVHKNDLSIVESTNLAGEARDEVTFKDVSVSSNQVKQLTENEVIRYQNLFTLSRIVLMAGGLERILELTIQYANERIQFGRPIGKFQAVKQQLAVMAGHIAAASLASSYAVEAIHKENATHEIAMAKVQVGEAVKIATEIAHQVHAAIGFTHEHPLHLNTRRLWSWRDEGGSESHWSTYIGNYILNEFEDAVWNFITATEDEVVAKI